MGMKKFVIDNPHPFIVQVNHSGEGFRGQPAAAPMPTMTAKNGFGVVNPTIIPINIGPDDFRGKPATEPLTTVTAKGRHALISPIIAQMGYGDGDSKQPRADTPKRPLWTILAGGKHAALVSAFLAKYYGGVVGADARRPCPTVTAIDHNALVAAHITKLRRNDLGQVPDSPLHAITAQGTHFAAVYSFLVKYFGNERDGAGVDGPLHTITGKDRFGLVMVYVDGEPYVIVDIGLRMLTPAELFACQGFPAHYHFDKGDDGKPLTKAAQVRMCGNSVCPPMAEVLVMVNYYERGEMRLAA